MYNNKRIATTESNVEPIKLNRKRSRVLILDDDIHLAKTLGRILQEKDIDSVVMDNPVDAYEYLRFGCVDLLITDLFIPAYSGKDLIDAIADIGSEKALPTIVYSGYIDPKAVKVIREIEHNGKCTFFEKSGKITHLCELVDEMVLNS